MQVHFLFSIQELANLGTAVQETGQKEEIKQTPDTDFVKKKNRCLLEIK